MTTLSAPAGFRGIFRTDADARAVYSESAGIGRRMPVAAAVPVDVDDLITLVRWASADGCPLTARGSGSSMPNGAITDYVIVDLSRWRRLGDVDVSRRTIRVGPGVTRGEVDRAARAHGLRFPVDPSSGEFCTIGGMAATNAAGSHSMHFGSMRRWVNALDCVFADGTRGQVRRGASPPAVPRVQRFLRDLRASEFPHAQRWHEGVIKDSSGYGFAAYARSGELVDLIVGSEGTLALFTEIELALIPVAQRTSSVLGAFASLDDAIAAAARARDAGAVACELLDRTFLDVAASAGAERKMPAETESALLAEVEGATAEEASAAARSVAEIFREAGASAVTVALDAQTETELWELRHAASPILARLDPHLRSMQFIEDCAVPRENLSTFVRGLREIFDRNATRGVIFGHAGDCHVHANAMIDPRQPGWRQRIDRILDQTVELTASLGGTLSGEHGDGRLRAPLANRVWPPEAIECFRAIKSTFDPLGTLNPFVKIAHADHDPLGEIKYDPDLAPLPKRARAALERVERERAYARFRLELLEEAP